MQFHNLYTPLKVLLNQIKSKIIVFGESFKLAILHGRIIYGDYVGDVYVEEVESLK